ncbi:MAG TPA: OsmC family protein [Aquaticitalea sp.]|nr:OsmC family protein [Aquaticitalea sp.]
MSQEHLYQVNLKWKNHRIGELSSPVLDTKIECATPPEFSNGVPNIWSPEHFYAAAISSCFMTTFLAIAENSRLSFKDFSCKTVCKLEIVERKYLITEAIIEPVVTLEHPDTDTEKALKVIGKTKDNCLVTNSMKTEIFLNPQIL